MKKLCYEGLNDLWLDYTSTVKEEKINLSETYIGQIKSFKIYQEDNRYYVANVLYVGANKKEFKQNIFVPKVIKPEVEKIGFFLKFEKEKYLPNPEVFCRCMNDYFGCNREQIINKFTAIKELRELASKFSEIGKIFFISYKKINGFRKLVGMKSACRESERSSHAAIEIAKSAVELEKMLNKKITFFSDYTEQKTKLPSLDFQFMFQVGEMTSSNGIPLYAEVIDNVSGRKSLKVSIIAMFNNRRFIIKSKELNHRTLKDSDKIVKDIIESLNECSNTFLDFDVSKNKIEEACLKYIPKKSRNSFISMISSEHNDKIKPIELAYDAMSSDIFNLKGKMHKTNNYDGGKSKYEVALGSVLIM